MKYDSPFVEMECCQLTKDGQAACGDDFQWLRLENENRNIAVLSDGLGSGIKAHLLANMTTTMALKFIRSNMDILQSAETIMDTLPVCEIRKISYATFTIFDMQMGGKTRVIEMGNPPFIHLRGALEIPPSSTKTLVSERWPDREMQLSELRLEVGDRLIACSDGVTQAGLGRREYKFGWTRRGCMQFIQDLIREQPDISAKDIAQAVAYQALSINRDHKCIDDISCMVIYLRRPRVCRVLTGPPFRKERDHEFAALALPETGADKVVICGGTTANIVERELRTKTEIDLKMVRFSKGLPPPGKIPGIGLVTEGILTLTRVASDLENGNWEDSPPAAKDIINEMMESDIIEFIVGTKVNEAHQDPNLPIDLEIRRNIIKRLQDVLQQNYRKKVTVKYY